MEVLIEAERNCDLCGENGQINLPLMRWQKWTLRIQVRKKA